MADVAARILLIMGNLPGQYPGPECVSSAHPTGTRQPLQGGPLRSPSSCVAGNLAGSRFLHVFGSHRRMWAACKLASHPMPASASWARGRLLAGPRCLTLPHTGTPWTQPLERRGDDRPSSSTAPRVIPGLLKTSCSSSGNVRRPV